ncbi:MAG: Na/Pi cotransporter family protein [Deltaproteobacteria bacterium]|jgi:phosphate:Na+ symporter|nr:Na/Pi cotransporter family protein [Deltaproteobacteria bacterium]
MSQTFDLWKLIAGLGIFLFGMSMVEYALRILSGRAFRRLIRQYTDGRIRSIGSGTLVTALLQSSSAVSLMVLAFVGAGVMSMQNAIGVIMGSNIGTTLTVWIVAIVGFKMKIEAFALPFIGLGGIGIIFCDSTDKPYQVCRLLIGFGFLFLGLDYMKSSVENVGQNFNLSMVPDYGLWVYLVAGTLLTAIMQASAASIAIVLTALHSGLITFDIGVAMVIGANVGTTITVILGSLGGIPAKKRVAFSHLIFNVATGIVAFVSIKGLVLFIIHFVDIQTNDVMGLALFHTIFNILGVILFFPFVGKLANLLYKIYPDRKPILTAYINNTPTEVIEAATSALRNEIIHLLHECQTYGLRLLKIDRKLVFEDALPLEKSAKKKLTLDSLYENIKLLHAEIFAYYSKLQNQKLEVAEVKEQERLIFSSRNIMNSIKNFKGIRNDLDEFDGSENVFMNDQYNMFRKRLHKLYHEMKGIQKLENREEQYHILLKTFVKIEEADKRCIKQTISAVAEGRIQELEISTMLLVNRLFTQACRLQIFSLKDLLLTQEQISNFDRALDMKEIIEEEKLKEA